MISIKSLLEDCIIPMERIPTPYIGYSTNLGKDNHFYYIMDIYNPTNDVRMTTTRDRLWRK